MRLASLYILLGLIIVTCNGDGTSPGPIDNTIPHTYGWDPPTKFADNTPLVPERDIEAWELYASPDGSFSDNDVPAAYLRALDNEGRLVTQFDLNHLAPHGIGPGFIIASKTVSIDNVGSGFSPPISWE